MRRSRGSKNNVGPTNRQTRRKRRCCRKAKPRLTLFACVENMNPRTKSMPRNICGDAKRHSQAKMQTTASQSLASRVSGVRCGSSGNKIKFGVKEKKDASAAKRSMKSCQESSPQKDNTAEGPSNNKPQKRRNPGQATETNRRKERQTTTKVTPTRQRKCHRTTQLLHKARAPSPSRTFAQLSTECVAFRCL